MNRSNSADGELISMGGSLSSEVLLKHDLTCQTASLSYAHRCMCI